MAENIKEHSELHTIRDTVESIWVAIVLAFVLRAFMIEAFVIPTGSMAPRLMGQHSQLQCPSCKYEFPFGQASDHSGRAGSSSLTTRCPSCGYSIREQGSTKGGDRVLVLKYLYRFAEPQRWDVVVFKNPQDNTQNYIKRLIGLPGEEIEIVHGDIFYRTEDNQTWRIARKPDRAQKAMWQIVFDNDYAINRKLYAETMLDIAPPAWRRQDGTVAGRDVTFSSGAAETMTFAAPNGFFLPHYGYNAVYKNGIPTNVDTDRDVCTDLRLSCTFHPAAPDARVQLHLTSFEHHFRGSVGADGSVALERKAVGESDSEFKTWQTGSIDPLKTGVGYEVALEHADMRVTLRVGDEAVLVSSDSDYMGGADTKDRMEAAGDKPIPTPQVFVSVTGGGCELRHLKVMRDVFYTCPTLNMDHERMMRGPRGRYAKNYTGDDGPQPESKDNGTLGWGTTGRPIKLLKHADRDLDEFFVLGDNSPQSFDSRAWVQAAPTLRLYDKDGNFQYKLGTVPRYNMIGKAFFVYWPSGFSTPALRDLPIIPNVGRMRLIR